jgi:hypothetical protein
MTLAQSMRQKRSTGPEAVLCGFASASLPISIMKSPTAFAIRGHAAATGRLAAALVFAGTYTLASAQLNLPLLPGTITVSANVYSIGAAPAATVGYSNTGATVTVSHSLYDPIALDNSGTATASGTGGTDPNMTLSTTGMYGSSISYTPFNYSVSGTFDYSFAVISTTSDQPAEVLINGSISASGSLDYPANYDITSDASPIPDENLLFNALNPADVGDSFNYSLSNPATQDFVIPLDVLTNTPYTIELYSAYFSDIAPDAVTVSMDPYTILAPQYSADRLIFSQGFGPSTTSTAPEGPLPLWMEGAAVAALVLWRRRSRCALG